MRYANSLVRFPNSDQTPVHILAPFSDVGQLESGRALVGGGRGDGDDAARRGGRCRRSSDCKSALRDGLNRISEFLFPLAPPSVHSRLQTSKVKGRKGKSIFYATHKEGKRATQKAL